MEGPPGLADLLSRALEADGVPPLSDGALLHLGAGPEGWLEVREDGRLVAFATLQDRQAELVVDPAARRRGVGGGLALRLLDSGATTAWAHGAHPGALALAERHHLHVARELHQLGRPLTDLPVAPEPDGLRTYTGADAEALVELNNRAFAGHPEQGGWTLEELQRHQAESWWDPAGLFLVEREGRLLGFHWTKVHPATKTGGGAGEVYVLGIDPDAQGLGLGRALTLVGLHHLAGLGLDRVLLYVDGANTAARHTYERLGFTLTATDLLLAR